MQDGFDSSAWVIEDIVFLPSVILLQNQFGYIVQCTTLRTGSDRPENGLFFRPRPVRIADFLPPGRTFLCRE